MQLAPKAPDEAKLYIIDLTSDLADGDDYINGFTLTVTGGAVVLTQQAYAAKVVSAVFGGGTNGTPGVFTLTVTTAGGQTIKKTLTLPILTTGMSPYTSTSKGGLVSYAYDEATLAGYEFDITDQEIATALQRLDALMAELAISGMDVGYNAPPSMGGSTMGDPSGVPDLAFQFVGLELAFRLFPTLGKQMAPTSMAAHARSRVAIRAWCARIPERPLPGGIPIGAGANRYRRWSPFTAPPRGYAASAVISTAEGGGGGGGGAVISDMAAIFYQHEAA